MYLTFCATQFVLLFSLFLTSCSRICEATCQAWQPIDVFLKAAFNSADRLDLWKALWCIDVPEILLHLIVALHENKVMEGQRGGPSWLRDDDDD